MEDKEFAKQLAELPKIVRDHLLSSELRENIRSVASEFGLNEDERILLENETVFVMLAWEDMRDLGRNISSELGIAKDKAGHIVNRLSEKAFKPVEYIVSAMRASDNILEDVLEEEGIVIPSDSPAPTLSPSTNNAPKVFPTAPSGVFAPTAPNAAAASAPIAPKRPASILDDIRKICATPEFAEFAKQAEAELESLKKEMEKESSPAEARRETQAPTPPASAPQTPERSSASAIPVRTPLTTSPQTPPKTAPKSEPVPDLRESLKGISAEDIFKALKQ